MESLSPLTMVEVEGIHYYRRCLQRNLTRSVSLFYFSVAWNDFCLLSVLFNRCVEEIHRVKITLLTVIFSLNLHYFRNTVVRQFQTCAQKLPEIVSLLRWIPL